MWFASYCIGAGVLPCTHPKGSGCGFPLSSKKKDEGDQGEKSKGHMIIFEEQMPLKMEEPLSEKEIEDRATIWVQSNVLEFSRRFGAAFEGCDNIAFELLM